jgi:hypothetical protein
MRCTLRLDKVLIISRRSLTETDTFPTEAVPLHAIRYVLATGDMYAMAGPTPLPSAAGQPGDAVLPSMPGSSAIAGAGERLQGGSIWSSLPSPGTLPVNKTATTACDSWQRTVSQQASGHRKMLDILGKDDRKAVPQSCSRTYPW